MKTPLMVASLALCCAVALGAQPRDQYFDAGGVRLHYVEQGSGEPVVLVHGLGNTLQIWTANRIAQALSGSYRVIALDLRGHGGSAKPHDPRAYGREMGRDIVRLLDHLGLQRAHVVGYSLGGNLTSQLLTLSPERFLSATLIAGPGLFSWDSASARGAEVEAGEREHDCISRTLLFRLTPPAARPPEDSLRAMSARCMADSTQDRFALAAITRARHDMVVSPEAVARVVVPTLGIVGSEDPFRAGFEELVKLRPAVKVVVVNGATHSGARGILGRPETIGALREFLAAHASR
jgi:pimeloyl-ACP methyl ester carboxylesterase